MNSSSNQFIPSNQAELIGYMLGAIMSVMNDGTHITDETALKVGAAYNAAVAFTSRNMASGLDALAPHVAEIATHSEDARKQRANAGFVTSS